MKSLGWIILILVTVAASFAVVACLPGCGSHEDAYTEELTRFRTIDSGRQATAVFTMYEMLSPEGKLTAGAKIHPPSTQEAVKMQAELDRLDGTRKTAEAKLAEEIARRHANNVRAQWLTGIGAAMLAIGIIGAVVAKIFMPTGVGWGGLTAVGGGALMFIGMEMGELSQFLSDHREFFGWSLTAGTAVLVGIVIHDYLQSPRGFKGMFFVHSTAA